MFNFIKGEIVEKFENQLIIENNGVIIPNVKGWYTNVWSEETW